MNGVDEVLSRIDFHVFYQSEIPGFKPNGNDNVLCRCPFPGHDDKNPSFSVNITTGLYTCFSCDLKGGNPIHFLRKKHNLDFKGALQKLKTYAGITDSGQTGKSKKTKKKASPASRKTSYLDLDRIKILHQQLMQNNKALKAFQDKYGLSHEIINKYFIGYQNERYVIPMEIEPGRWTFKEHKGKQSRGAKVSLYPCDVIYDSFPYQESGLPVVITEGEFKALLLNQMGFHAVSGTGGARTWKKEWNSVFEGLDVILAYDNDDPGKQGALRIADNLKGTANSVKTVQWPPTMNSKDKKDVTDYFLALGKKKEDFQRLIDKAREIGREIKEIDGIKFIEPEGFEVKENCVYQISYVGNKPVKRAVFHTPLFITSRALDVDTGTEEVEVTFKRDGKWKRIWVPKRTISDMRKIVEFSDHGLPVTSVNAKRIIEYLSFFEAYNMDLIKLSFVAKGVGWKTVVDKNVFILHKPVLRSNKEKDISIEFVAEAGFERFVKAMKPQGKYPQWREYVTGTLKYPLANFAFYASFAAPLLKILKAPNFIIDFWGNTSVGKTTVLELASSVWGNPHKEAGGLIFGWDSTKVFLERLANFFCDVPIFPDDSQTVDNRTMEKTLYMIANGTGKGRGSLLGIRHNLTWHTVCFSTGEKPLTECTAFAGAKARTISLYGSPFANAGGNFINDLKQGLREHYGHAGPRFVQALLSFWEKPNEMTKLKEEYRRYQSMLSLEANSEVGDRYSHYFSVVKIAADLVYRNLGIGDPVEAEESLYRVFNNVVSESHTDADIGIKAMEFVISWLNSNENLFQKEGHSVKDGGRESLGVWKIGEYIGIYPHIFKEILSKEGYSDKSILRDWNEKNWIERKDDNHLTCRKRIIEKGVSSIKRLVTIPWEIIEKFYEK